MLWLTGTDVFFMLKLCHYSERYDLELLMSKREESKKVTLDMIYRSVASSTAIETGIPTKIVEKKLKENRKKYQSLSLAL